MKMLGSVQKDLHELQMQANRIQVGAGQASATQVSLVLGMSHATELVRTLDIHTVALIEGSLHEESVDDLIILSTFKNIGLNITMLPNELLHALQVGVTKELRAWEKHPLNLISEYKVNNEQMFTEKMQALKEKETLQAQSSRLDSVVTKAYRTVSKLHIPEDAQLEAKIGKLAIGMREVKAEVGRVQFEINMKITELQIKLHPTTLLEVRE